MPYFMFTNPKQACINDSPINSFSFLHYIVSDNRTNRVTVRSAQFGVYLQSQGASHRALNVLNNLGLTVNPRLVTRMIDTAKTSYDSLVDTLVETIESPSTSSIKLDRLRSKPYFMFTDPKKAFLGINSLGRLCIANKGNQEAVLDKSNISGWQ